MTDYNITREEAASLLGVSTRTIDRYIKKWLLSYKKVWNRVYLSKEELESINFDKEIVYQWDVVREIIKIDEIKDNIIKKIDENSKIIFYMQNKINEIENKLNIISSLPNYMKEKEKILIEKEKIETEYNYLLENNKKLKILNIILLIFIIFLLLIFLFF